MFMGNERNDFEQTTPVSPWLNTKAAAEYLTASPKTLAVWRCEGRGPNYHTIGKRLVRYHKDELDAFIRNEGDT